MKKIKVAYICSFSNEKVRKHIKYRTTVFERLLYKLAKRNINIGEDTAIWNTNAIAEFEKIEEIELHVITPIRNLANTYCEFSEDAIHYHFFKDENSSPWKKIIRFLFTKNSSMFKTNRKRISYLLKNIQPDIVHIVGAENPLYSLSLLDLSPNIPSILQLQALLDSIKDKPKSKAGRKSFAYKGELERILISKADFISAAEHSFVEYIRKNIKKDAIILNGNLAMAQQINIEPCEKQYDFVHYASTLTESKATDIAIESFIIAHKQNPSITLDIIGCGMPDFMDKIKSRITEAGIADFVKFEGRLKTHDDVIRQVRKSRFALLPLKVSLVPNTLHEAMANGLPLITTITPGTPEINAKKQCALISEQNDCEDIANNMLRLIDEPELSKELIANAAEYEYQRSNNRDICLNWVNIYKACINNKLYGTEIPKDYLT